MIRHSARNSKFNRLFFPASTVISRSYDFSVFFSAAMKASIASIFDKVTRM
ncbi:MAG TPA: hypothetical protein PK175_11160 [Syntrophales bacterium]|nr:hypothetical protein [Syntrophales bacterium]